MADAKARETQRKAAEPTVADAKGMQMPAAASAEAGGGSCECGCRYKSTERSADLKRDLDKRLNRVIGQLNGVKNMLDDNRYCGDVLIQLAAAESAVRRISDIILKNHLETCVVEKIQAGDLEAVDEVMDLIKRFRS